MGVQIAKSMGMRVIVIDGGSEKRDLAINKLGAEHFVDFTEVKDVAAEVIRLTGGKGAHGVFVTAGNKSAYESAPKMVRVGGRVMCVGLRECGSFPFRYSLFFSFLVLSFLFVLYCTVLYDEKRVE